MVLSLFQSRTVSYNSRFIYKRRHQHKCILCRKIRM